MNLEARLDDVRAEYLQRMTAGDGRLLQQVEHYATQHNGKMLRPRMTLLSAATLGEEHFLSRRTLLLAVCVEMLHNASLLHDDVIDHADTRRGLPTVNAHWSNSVAVLVGDYHLAKIMELLDEVGDADASRLVNQTVKCMVEAELLQLEQPSTAGRQLPAASYQRIIDGKTARLFATAAALGNPDHYDFGLRYGRLFQICDDLRDNEAPAYARQMLDNDGFALPEAFADMPDPRTILQ